MDISVEFTIINYVWWSGKSSKLSQTEYFNINVVSKSQFLYESDALYLKKTHIFYIFIIM